jgi:hypothetical protein
MNHHAMLRPIWKAIYSLRSCLKSLQGNKNLLIIIAGVVLASAYFFFGGLLPDYYISTHYTEGHKIVALYSHLYRYCEFFGWLAVLLLIPAVTFLHSQKIDVRKNKFFILVALLLLILFPLAAVLIDQRSRNAAPHEVRPDIVESNPALKNHFIKGPPTQEQKEAYQSMMNSLLKDKTNRSVARHLHYLTIYLLTLQLVAVGVVVVALLRFGPVQPPSQSSRYTSALVSCSLAIFVSYLWVLMRVAFIAQKLIYFPTISLPVTDAVLLGFSLLATLVIGLRLLNLYERQQALSLLIALALPVFGLLMSGFNWAEFQEMLVTAFGRDAELTQYWLILGATIFLLLFVALIGHPQKGSPQDQEN